MRLHILEIVLRSTYSFVSAFLKKLYRFYHYLFNKFFIKGHSDYCQSLVITNQPWHNIFTSITTIFMSLSVG